MGTIRMKKEPLVLEYEDGRKISNLFVAGERFGWIYREQPPARKCPLAPPPPYAPSDAAALPGCALVLAVPAIVLLLVVWWLLGRSWAMVVLVAAVALLAALRVAEREAEKEEAEAKQAHDQLVRDYERAVAENDASERRRVESGPVWFPLRSQTGALQVRVFGGTATSQEEFVLCVGSSALADGQSVLVADLTRRGVAGKLVSATRSWGRAPFRTYACGEAVNVLLGSVSSPADLIADAVDRARGVGGTDESRRSAYANLLHRVAGCLDGQLTVARLAEGLRLLQRVDPGPDARLTDAERSRVTGIVDSISVTERQRENVEHLCNELEALARVASAPDDGHEGEWREPPLLTVLSTAHSQRARMPLVDALAGQFVLDQLMTGASSRRTLIVAGAQELSSAALKDLQDEADRQGVRLICVFEHVHDNSLHRLGPPGTAVAFMQLADHKDSLEAAEFIGRGHKYILSQITQSTGDTETTGDSTANSQTLTTTRTTGTNWNKTEGGNNSSRSRGGSTSDAESRGDTHTTGQNRSRAHSTNSGTVEARVYEFEIEPTTLQSLDPTALLFVDNGPRGRLVVAGICNSDVAATARVSALPAEQHTHEAPAGKGSERAKAEPYPWGGFS